MSNSVLGGIEDFEAWADYVQSLSSFTGNTDIISSFDYANITQLTVGQYLSFLDLAEAALLNYDWTALVSQLTAILNNPQLAGQFSEEQKALILNELGNLNSTDLINGFNLIRAELAGVSVSTLLFDALNDATSSQTPSDGSDVIIGTAGDDVFDLLGGNDAFWAGASDVGNDSITAGAGNDTMGGGAGNDTLVGGEGNDLAFGGSGEDSLNMGDGEDFAWGGSGNDQIFGGEGNDILGGGSGNDTIDSGAGNDLVYAGSGAGNDNLTGGSGDDVIFAGGGQDYLYANEGNDTLYSGAGSDWVEGGDGNDLIYAGADNDQFTGGLGDDTFAFNDNGGFDTVIDFQFEADSSGTTGDILDLSEVSLINSFSDVLAAMVDDVSGARVSMGDGIAVTFTGLTVADFTSATEDWAVF